MNAIRNKTMFRGCLHPDAQCNGITSKAHSIQYHRHLDKLSIDGEVLCIDFGKLDLNNNIILNRVGKKKASIFTGFCNHHDSTIFRPIEDSDYEVNNKEHNFLFAYRAFALSYFERQSSYNFRKEYLEIIREKGQNVKNFEVEVAYYKKHLELIESIRISMNNNLDNKRFDRVHTQTLIWPHNSKIAATSMFFINKDKEGNVINKSSYISPFFFTIFPQNDETYVLMSCLSKDKTRYQFIKNQIVDAEISEQKMLVSNILAMNVENFFIAPDRWFSIPINMRDLFINVFKSTVGKEKPPIGYYKNLNLFI